MSGPTLIERAIAVFGPDVQLRKLQEECCELGVAVNHHAEGCKNSLNKIAEETADVELMRRSGSKIVGDEAVDKWLDYKVNRLRERVESAGKGA